MLKLDGYSNEKRLIRQPRSSLPSRHLSASNLEPPFPTIINNLQAFPPSNARQTCTTSNTQPTHGRTMTMHVSSSQPAERASEYSHSSPLFAFLAPALLNICCCFYDGLLLYCIRARSPPPPHHHHSRLSHLSPGSRRHQVPGFANCLPIRLGSKVLFMGQDTHSLASGAGCGQSIVPGLRLSTCTYYSTLAMCRDHEVRDDRTQSTST